MHRRVVLAGLAGLLSFFLGAPCRAQILPPRPPPTREMERYDWRYAGRLQAFADRIQDSMVRLEHVAEKASDLEVDRIVDGVGVAVGPHTVVSPSKWLAGAKKIWAIHGGERLGEARIVARDEAAGLVLLTLSLPEGHELQPVAGFSALPLDTPAEVALPTVVGQEVGGVSRGVAIHDTTGLFVGGVLRNGVPAFDAYARVVALCLRPTPDQGRTLAISGGEVTRFLESTEAAPAPPKTLEPLALPPLVKPVKKTDPAP